MEDLWAFNEEIVADAVFQCRTPVISAVGHETDTTISDYVADLRAPTPSAAVELAIYDARQALEALYTAKDRMARAMLSDLEDMREHLEQSQARLKFLNPGNQLDSKRQYLTDMEEKLSLYMERILQEKKHAFAMLSGRLDSVSPLKRLQEGYAYVAGKDGHGISSVEEISVGDSICVSVTDGSFQARVTQVNGGQS